MKLKRLVIFAVVLFSFLYVQSWQVEALELPTVSYQTHVQKNGWMPVVTDGELSGTTGLAYRMEALKISVDGAPDLGVRYSSHVQGIGWQPYVNDNAVSGTEGEAKRLEAMKVELTGDNAKYFDIYYRVHVEKFGWLDWAKNGHAAGSAGYGYRVEALEVKIQYKGDIFEGAMETPYQGKFETGDISYRTHVESFGWLPTVSDGELSGTTGKAKRMESVEISLSDRFPSGSVVYSTHVQSIGWMDPVKDGALSGTTGLAKRLEGIKIHLEGEISKMYGVTYRTHVQGIGWTSWVKDGALSGTTGEAKRLEAIEIKLYEKEEVIPERPKPEEPVAYSIYKVTANPTLNFRSSPVVTSSTLIGKINYNEEVIVFEIDKNNWARIEYEGKAGYVSAVYLTKVRDVVMDPLPVVLDVDAYKTEYDNEDVIISGIALSYSGLESLKATLDGTPVTVTRNDRPELESVYKDYPDKVGMGFTIQLAKSIVSSGTHELVIKARSNDYSSVSKTVSFSMKKSQTYVTIDTLKNGQEQPNADVLVKGVALSAEGVSSVTYSVNGVKKGEARYGLASPEHGFPEYEEVTDAGYEFTLMKTDLTKPVNSVRVEVTGNDGTSEYHAIIIKGAPDAAYSFEEYNNSLMYYVDKEYTENAIRYNTPGTALWNTLRTQMNPASFIHDEIYKYMFMDLSYSTTQFTVTEETLNKILSGMGILENTGHIFLAAAIEHKVNPYYLVVHAILETGRGTSVLSNGQEVTFLHEKFGDADSPKKDVEPKTVYNMFGIGAWDVNPNLWGAQKAYSLEWFTPEAAIAGGIKYIADDYVVSRNQNTLFKMRYNLKGNMTHQYATDPLWAYKQASILKREFDKYGIKENFSYIVPVYMQ